MSSLESRLMQAAEEQFEQACKALVPSARINAAAVTSALEAFNHSDPTEAEFAPAAVAMAIASLHSWLLPLVRYSVDLEQLSARDALVS